MLDFNILYVKYNTFCKRSNYIKCCKLFKLAVNFHTPWEYLSNKSAKNFSCCGLDNDLIWTTMRLNPIRGILSVLVYSFYHIHFEITGYPCNVIGSQRCDLFTNRTIFCSKSHLFSANENWTVKQKTNQI